eukprot:CAMPEP_0197321814 /NCGR_PEP_ID=MMETSP0891-20130614/66478_1 /TAXON_ID=44058 ORGANISM="Aureoumbra lagunensis, Strain CCMP1510" /NCGR_SAMPLE_ID=MMETSP0891 /ASSEMBLY_ACC=CAM_ASM_000534 /LENGTH=505 /DNA_ID=CAMNT_0042813877 /DNA_START=184 /DNA_END=1701 /DNA_ORIENTATION=-
MVTLVPSVQPTLRPTFSKPSFEPTPRPTPKPTRKKEVAKEERPRRRGIFEMSAKEQRKHLRALHMESGPGTKAADIFIAYARKFNYSRATSNAESILIVTASYRDPEAPSTIARAFARATNPQRIHVAIHAQNVQGNNEPERDPIGGLHFLNVSCPKHPVCAAVAQNRVRVSYEFYKRAEGPTVAKSLAERLYQNETYALVIDSHCHFAFNWDNLAIEMFQSIGNDHAILTAYPDGYPASQQRGNGLDSSYAPKIDVSRISCITRTRRVNVHNTVSFKHDMRSCAIQKGSNPQARVAFFAAGFSFSKGHRILRVPFDYHTPYLFDGEEISLGVRAWSWGYDFYLPTKSIISHLYIPANSPLRPVFWTLDWGLRWPLQYRSLLRVHRQLRINNNLSPDAQIDLINLDDWERYDTGPRRDPRDFFKWASVDVKRDWGDKCSAPPWMNENKPQKAYCWSKDLSHDYEQVPGGLPYVPWKSGTEDLFPPLIRTSSYPPPIEQHWSPSPS